MYQLEYQHTSTFSVGCRDRCCNTPLQGGDGAGGKTSLSSFQLFVEKYSDLVKAYLEIGYYVKFSQILENLSEVRANLTQT